jgi:hypothetical protein
MLAAQVAPGPSRTGGPLFQPEKQGEPRVRARSGQRYAVIEKRQARMEIRVIANRLQPALGEICPLFAVAHERIRIDPPACRLPMNQDGFGRPNIGQSEFTDSQAQVDVAEVDGDIFSIEATDPIEL